MYFLLKYVEYVIEIGRRGQFLYRTLHHLVSAWYVLVDQDLQLHGPTHISIISPILPIKFEHIHRSRDLMIFDFFIKHPNTSEAAMRSACLQSTFYGMSL